jgi:hypothetical protein
MTRKITFTDGTHTYYHGQEGQHDRLATFLRESFPRLRVLKIERLCR